MSANIVDRVGFGVAIDGNAFDGSTVLGTTPVKVTLATNPTGLVAYIACRIVNPNATAVLAFRVVPKGNTAPVYDATFSPSGGGWVLPGQTVRVVIPATVDLYVVASAAASSWGVASDVYV